MNDQFLFNIQEPPRPEFAAALYQRINQPMKTSSIRMRLFASGLSLAGLALLLTLLFSPAARVYAQNLIFQIGHLFISSEPTYAEQFESKLDGGTPTVDPAGSPVPIEWQAPPLLSLAEASAQASLSVAEIGSLPEGFTLTTRYVSLPDETNLFTSVTTTYVAEESSLVLSQTIYQPGADPQELPVGDATITAIAVQGVEGVWIENLRLSTYVDENNQVAKQYANVLAWEKDGFEFYLQSTPGLSQDEMLAIANSLQP